jgi:hypothetical protein
VYIHREFVFRASLQTVDSESLTSLSVGGTKSECATICAMPHADSKGTYVARGTNREESVPPDEGRHFSPSKRSRSFIISPR